MSNVCSYRRPGLQGRKERRRTSTSLTSSSSTSFRTYVRRSCWGSAHSNKQTDKISVISRAHFRRLMNKIRHTYIYVRCVCYKWRDIPTATTRYYNVSWRGHSIFPPAGLRMRIRTELCCSCSAFTPCSGCGSSSSVTEQPGEKETNFVRSDL